jgi:hypothetical protein
MVENCQSERPLRKPKYRREVNIKTDHRDIRSENVAWIHLAHDVIKCQAFVSMAVDRDIYLQGLVETSETLVRLAMYWPPNRVTRNNPVNAFRDPTEDPIDVDLYRDLRLGNTGILCHVSRKND